MVEKAGCRYVVELTSWDGVGMHGSNGPQSNPGDQSRGEFLSHERRETTWPECITVSQPPHPSSFTHHLSQRRSDCLPSLNLK